MISGCTFVELWSHSPPSLISSYFFVGMWLLLDRLDWAPEFSRIAAHLLRCASAIVMPR